MGLISKMMDYVRLSAEERMNKMYVEHPDLLLKKLEESKQDALDRVIETAARLAMTRTKWRESVTSTGDQVNKLDRMIKNALAAGDNATANSLAGTWQSQKRLHQFYTDGIEKLDKTYNDMIGYYNEIESSYEVQIQKVKSTICSYEANQEILKASAFLKGINVAGIAGSPDVEDIVRSLNDENIRIESRLKVITDFTTKDCRPTVAEVNPDTSALEEWKKQQ